MHVDRDDLDVGAGDQGIMFGYATDETPEYMPLTCQLSHALNAKLAELRRSSLPWLGPDTKTQVCVFPCTWCRVFALFLGRAFSF